MALYARARARVPPLVGSFPAPEPVRERGPPRFVPVSGFEIYGLVAVIDQ